MCPSITIRSWPESDRPREKLLRLGEDKLTDSELLAILIQTGCRGSSALELARQILNRFQTFRELGKAGFKEGNMFKGLGPAKIAVIKAAIEIGRRLQEERLEDQREPVESSADIARMFMGRMRDLDKEILKIVFLNSANKIISVMDAAEGTVNAAYPILREIFASALRYGASALICVHNHPSGDHAPSPEDRRFTAELRQVGAVLDIAVLDHIIIGNDRYYSFTDHDGQGGQSIK